MSVNSIMSNTFAVVQSPQRSFQTMCLVCSFTPYSKKSWRFDSGLHKCRNSPGKNPSLKLHGFMVMFMGLELRVDSYKRPLKMADFKAKGWFCKAPYVNLAVLKEHGASRCRPVVLRDTHLLPAQAFLPPPSSPSSTRSRSHSWRRSPARLSPYPPRHGVPVWMAGAGELGACHHRSRPTDVQGQVLAEPVETCQRTRFATWVGRHSVASLRSVSEHAMCP